MDTKYFVSQVIRYLFFSKSLGTHFFMRRYFDKNFLLKDDPYTGETPIVSNRFWTMWLQDDIPELCSVCINSIKKFHPDVVVITEKNLFEYVNISQVIWDKYKAGKMLPAHFSDLVRMCLLDKYGGTWIDATCYMTQKVPDFILKSSFYVMKDLKRRHFSNFFIHSAPNNYITKCIKNCLLRYWEHENIAISYFLFHFFVTKFIRYDKQFKEEWEKVPVGLNSMLYLLAPILYEDYNSDVFDWFKNSMFLQKLTYKKHEQNDVNPNSYYRYILKEDTKVSP